MILIVLCSWFFQGIEGLHLWPFHWAFKSGSDSKGWLSISEILGFSFANPS